MHCKEVQTWVKATELYATWEDKAVNYLNLCLYELNLCGRAVRYLGG